MSKCISPKADGTPCGMPPLEDSEYCWAHDPSNGQARAEARKRGGENRQTPKADRGEIKQYRSVAAVQALLEETVADTLVQENSAQRSKTIGQLAGLLLKAVETGEIESRLEAIESALRLNKGRAA